MKLNHISTGDFEEIAFTANYSCFSIFSSGRLFVHRSRTIIAVLIEGHLINIP